MLYIWREYITAITPFDYLHTEIEITTPLATADHAAAATVLL